MTGFFFFNLVKLFNLIIVYVQYGLNIKQTIVYQKLIYSILNYINNFNC